MRLFRVDTANTGYGVFIMRHGILNVLVSLSFLLTISSDVLMADEMLPEKIIARGWELYRQTAYEKELIKIVVSYADNRKEEKRLIRWTKFDPASEDRVTIKFVEPPLDRGLGLLTLRHPAGSDEQWLKLPSLKKVRKISVGEQEKYFAGTDFTNEDVRQLVGERVQDFAYSLVRKEGENLVIEAVPRPEIETGYGRRILWVSDKFVMTRIEYYSKKGDLIKTQVNNGITVSGNGLWRPRKVELENLLLGRKTSAEIEQRELKTDIQGDIFSKDFLESERM